MFEAIGAGFAALFIVGGFWFYLTAAILFFVIMALSEHEQNAWSGIIMAGFIYLLHLFNPLIQIGWTTIVWGVLVYLSIGGGWSIVKWFSFLRLRSEKFVELKLEWAKQNGREGVTASTNVLKEFGEDVYDNLKQSLYEENFIRYKSDPIIPAWGSNRSKFVGWILWWPTSMFWTLLSDPLARIARWIVDNLGNLYAAIARRVFAKVGIVDEG